MIKEKIVFHKRILDRGRNYYGYIQMITTALILVGVFKIKQWYFIVCIILIFLILTYLMGLIDNDKILQEEQKQTSEKNPMLMEMYKKINTIYENTRKDK